MMTKVRSIKYNLLLQFIVLIFTSVTVNAQSRAEMKKIFTEAESKFLFGEYELANPLYLLLDKTDNYNIKYKIGVCYLNIPGEKANALSFLESAVKNASYESKSSSFKEKRAPYDAYFSLAKAYMINNELEKALSTFYTFKKLTEETKLKGGMKNLSFIDQEIQACNNAVSNIESPFRISKRLVSPGFSQGSINENPAVSFDGNTIVYTERRGLLNAIMFSKKVNGKWQPPVEINSQLESGDDCSSSSLNKDGTLLFLYKTDNFDGNIYSSEYVKGSWTPIKKLNRNINTKYYESHASISADGKQLYFTSNREGGNGGLDIYISEKEASGDWGPAINLGKNINTIYNEDTPFVTLNDSILYFSSEGHSGMGGYDIYRSSGNGSVWKAPQNMGFPINSTDDDLFFQPFNNDENGFYSLTTAYKKKEIFYITLTNYRLNKIFELTGNYSLKDTLVTFDETNSIYLVDKIAGDTIETGYPDRETGKYNFIVAPGRYRLVYTGPSGYYAQQIDTVVAMTNPSKVINLRDIILDKNPPATKPVYEKLDLTKIPLVDKVDSSLLIRNLNVYDISENDQQDTSILYYTVQVMALYNPVDISYFRYVNDIKVFYNEADLFYRYTTGIFKTKDAAYSHRDNLIDKGYPDDLFIKKVKRGTGEKSVPTKIYYTIQLKATTSPANISQTFPGLKGVTEAKEIDGMYHYLYGRYTSHAEASMVMKRKQIREFSDAFIREISIIIKK